MFKSKKLSKFKMIRHGFFNRFGGVSKGIYKGLNCGLGSDDKTRDVSLLAIDSNVTMANELPRSGT